MRVATVAGLMVAAAIAAGVLSPAARGHAERATFFPDHTRGERPTYRISGPSRVVCKSDSAQRIRRSWAGSGPRYTKRRRERLRMLRRCRYEHIQEAVDAARNGDRILVMPGVYREEPSRAVTPKRHPDCSSEDHWEPSGDNHTEDGMVPTYLTQFECPNSRSLIAIIGDSLDDPDRECDRKCDLQIAGMGRRAADVLIVGDRLKEDVIRADRADGFLLRNVTLEEGAYNNVNVVETNGYRITKVVTRYAQNYGVLAFASDNGMIERVQATGNGDSGIYPGSGPEGHCARYGVTVRHNNSYGNALGYSGTAGNGTRVYGNRFHDNAAGMSVDSFAPGHPGMPQDCSRWTGNDVYSNNLNIFDDENEAYCNSTPFEERRREVVCPQFQVVVGVGFMMYGANDNLIRGNRFWDNWRNGIRLFQVPATLRGDNDPANQLDTSHGNRFVANTFGVAPDGSADPNGVDVYWTEQGLRNCWQRNRGYGGSGVTSQPEALPSCESGGSLDPVGNPATLAGDVPCAAWHPEDNPDPPGCVWFTTPEEPQP